jgi:hypothetical protein
MDWSNWKDSKAWADSFMPEIKAILGIHIIGEAPYEEDAERATDLIVLRMEPVRIAVRMRTAEKARPSYLNEFTIRYSLASGRKTELAKILAGFGNYLFYGFEDPKTGNLGRWTLIDLSVFREEFCRKLYQCKPPDMPGKLFQNRDELTSFRVFRYQDYPAEMIRAQGDGFPQFSRPTAKAIDLTYADFPF